MKYWLFAGAIFAFASFTNTVNAEAPETLTLNGSQMVKLGEGTRRKFFVSVYDISLYVTEGQEIESVTSDGINPMALRLEVTSSRVTTALFTEVVRDGFKKYANYQEIETLVDTFLDQFVEEIVEGDVYTVYADPFQGVITYRNDDVLTIVDSPMFKEGMFEIWLGERPVSRRLKAELLGQR
jgi:hypothetical protein